MFNFWHAYDKLSDGLFEKVSSLGLGVQLLFSSTYIIVVVKFDFTAILFRFKYVVVPIYVQ